MRILISLALCSLLQACTFGPSTCGPDGGASPVAAQHHVRGAFATQASYTCAGQVSAPDAGTAVCQTSAIGGTSGAASYDVQVLTQQTGTVDTSHPTNLVLQQGTSGSGWVAIATLLSLGSSNLFSLKAIIGDGNRLRVIVGGADFGGSSLINAWISARLTGSQL